MAAGKQPKSSRHAQHRRLPEGSRPVQGARRRGARRTCGGLEVEFFTAGTTIFKQGGRPQDEVRMIRRGAVELVENGRVLDLLGEGEREAAAGCCVLDLEHARSVGTG